MTVLLSIRPEFAIKIFDGSKRYEYRRAIFRRKDVERVVVYASHPLKCVIGEFEIAEVLYDKVPSLWARTKHCSGISKRRFLDYFRDKAKGYAIKVKSTTAYSNPLPLTQLMVVSPPQSFVYLRA